MLLDDNGLGKQRGKVYANAGRAFIHWQTDSDGSLKNAYDLCKQFGHAVLALRISFYV